MGMAAPAVGAHFARTKLVPRLRHVQHHAVPIERLEGEDRVGRDLRQETRVGIAVRIGRLPITGEFTHRNLAENPKLLVGMTEELGPRETTRLARRLHRENPHRMDVVVQSRPASAPWLTQLSDAPFSAVLNGSSP